MGFSARTLVDAVPTATALLDADGRVMASNEHWTEHAVGDVYAAESAVLPDAGYAALFAALGAGPAETLMCRHDEPAGHRLIRVAPVTDEDGATGYLFTVSRGPWSACPGCGGAPGGDPELAADHAKSEFLALLGHEIRTPVTAVMGMVDLMRSLPIPLETREVVDGVHRSAQALHVLIEDLVDLARLQTDRLELSVAPLSPRELLESVIEPLQEDARRKGILLLPAVAPGLPNVVLGDFRRLRQVLTNLVGNAVKFTEHGEVVVTAQRTAEPTRPGDHLLITVSDTGRGLDDADRARIFAPFVQVDSSMTRRHEGAGLGLAVAARLVAKMGGAVEVDSQPGVGSEFRIRLPLVAGPDDAVPAAGLPGLAVRRIAVVAPTRRSTQALVWLLDAAGAEAMPATLADVTSRRMGCDGVLWCDNAHDPAVLTRAKQMRAAVGPGGRAVMLSATDPRTGAVRGPWLITSPVTLRRLVAVLNTERRGVRGAPIPVEPLGSGRVLLAEDNEVNRGVFRRMIELLGLECEPVADGQAAVRAVLGDRAYDVVLMDLQMPGMDGLEATRRIRAAGVTVPVLALTAAALRDDLERCADAGMNAHISKPVTLGELRAALARHIPAPAPAAAAPSAEGAAPGADRGSGAAAPPGRLVDLARLMDLEEQLADRPLLVATVDTFLSELPGRRAALAAALSALDRDRLRAVAHTLKSSSALLGAAALAAACAEVERHAPTADQPELAELVGAVDSTATGSATALREFVHEAGVRSS